jgi:hypothetical protein
MSKLSHLEAMTRYLYNMGIQNIQFTSQKYKEIQEIGESGFTDNIVKKLLFEITNYNNDMLVNLLYFVERLKIDANMKEDIRIQIFSMNLTEENLYNIYDNYVDYLDILPIG